MAHSIYVTWRINKYIYYDISPITSPNTVVFVIKNSALSNNILDKNIMRSKNNISSDI